MPSVDRVSRTLMILVAASVTVFAQASGQYALILKDPSVSTRFVSREALSSPGAESYRQQVVRAQESLRQAVTEMDVGVPRTDGGVRGGDGCDVLALQPVANFEDRAVVVARSEERRVGGRGR